MNKERWGGLYVERKAYDEFEILKTRKPYFASKLPRSFSTLRLMINLSCSFVIKPQASSIECVLTKLTLYLPKNLKVH